MWTDAHIHLYDTRRTTVTWPETASPFPRSVYVPDFLEIAEPCGISRMVSVECTVGGPEEVDNWTLTLTRHDPAVAAVIACADMTSPDFEAVHNRYLEFPKYRGIRVNAIPEEKLSAFRDAGRRDIQVPDIMHMPVEVHITLPECHLHFTVILFRFSQTRHFIFEYGLIFRLIGLIQFLRDPDRFSCKDIHTHKFSFGNNERGPAAAADRIVPEHG